MIKTWIWNSKNISRDSYFWNMVSSILFGFQSVILLVVLTRTVGLIDSGIFTLAYANASLFLLIGKYGVRNYQVSDIDYEHSFQDYRMARYLSTVIMVFSAILYLLYTSLVNHYTWKKSIVILLMCFFKVPDALEDVYFGEFQRKGRLDVAAKEMTIRLGSVILLFSLAIIISRNLIVSLLITTIASFFIMILFLKWTTTLFNIKDSLSWKSVWLIMKNCFPLFSGFFLSQYIGNAPKYAIDAQLGDEIQACYGFISMPVFVIGLFSNIIYSPIIRKMATYWKNKEMKKFLKRFIFQVMLVFGITMACVIGAYWIGIPVLSLLYHTNLSAYQNEFLILMLGGGCLALVGLLNITITIMRFQYYLFIGYVLVALAALLFSNKIVMISGINGAAWLYMMLMGTLLGIFILIFVMGLWSTWKKYEENN